MEKTFRLVRGNEKGFFKVRKDKNVNLLYRTMLILTANDVENLQLKNQFVQVEHQGNHVAQLVTRREIMGPVDFELELEVRINRNGKSE